MRFLHISDLHLGKRLNGFSMIEDQKYILGQLLGIARSEHTDAVLIAGDIYDKAVPPAEAVQVLDWFLTELVGQGHTVFAVSGNHDSAERIAFGARLMRGKVYLSPVYDGNIPGIRMEDDYGELFVYLLPFVKPAAVRHALGGEQGGELPETYQDAVGLAVSRMGVDRKKRNILVAHQFVTGAGRCESEEITVGGLDQVDAQVFDPFDYAALGHIHSPQWIGRETVRYCGTPLKYSFSEAEQVKSATILEIREKGDSEISTIPLHPLHDMRKIRGTYLEVTARDFYQGMDREDYLQVTLTDEEDIPDGMQKLRVIYPNLMHLEYDNQRTRQNQDVQAAGDIPQKSELELFGEFYESQNNQPMGEEQRAFVSRLIEEAR